MATSRQKTLKSFFQPSTDNRSPPKPETIVKAIIDEIVISVVEKSFRKHDGQAVLAETERSWKSQYPWLQVETYSDTGVTKKLIHCSVCQEHKKSNSMATKGSKNIQLSTIKAHDQSSEHRDAVRLSRQLKRTIIFDELEQNVNEPNQDPISESDKLVFRSIYFCAKEELPSEKINKLLEFSIVNGLDSQMQNLRWTTIHEIQTIISKLLQNNVIQKIRDSDCFGIMIDESCDLSVEKKLLICVRYVDKGCPQTSYLGSIRIDDGRAHTITNHIHELLTKLGLDLTKMVGLGTDGAATMTGCRMGVGVQIKSKYSPFITQVHCFAHRLALGSVDSIKGNKQLEKFKSMFNTLFIHFSSSAVRSAKLREMQVIFDDPELKIKEPHVVRWLSLKRAVEVVHECYPSIVATLSELGVNNSTAKALHTYFDSKKSAILTSFMLDIHEEIASFSRSLQKENLIFSEVKPKLEGTLASLNVLNQEGGGRHFKEMCRLLNEDGSLKGVPLSGNFQIAKTEVLNLVGRYIECLQSNLRDRLTQQDGDTLCNLSAIFEPTIFHEELADGAIDDLAEFYGREKVVKITENDEIRETPVRPLLDENGLKLEWNRLKAMIKGTYRNLSMKMLIRNVLLLHEDMLPNMSKLCKIALCMCITSVACERSFSLQNRLKNKFRCSLRAENLDILMRICSEGPDFKDYDPCPAIRLWRDAKARRITRLAQPYKSRMQ